MRKYLWHLDLNKIPCGWENVYQDALKNCPNGMPLLIKGTKFFYHPVKYRETLLEIFSTAKEKCLEIMKNECLDRKQLSELLENDIILFNVLFEWCLEDMDETFFDVNRFKDKHQFKNVAIYFEETDDPFSLIADFYYLKYFRVNNAVAR
ncbi:hypothetical protein [Anoxybacillus sp. ST4]|uniref:hypothetical protein n=1 Tax=Anoxybacillus sp. ST4 TaxID=2864181 RepID=UPI001C64326B|nr:hypothetical protein [Anoxybacillus sp. ST4]MBW7651543.1 hypothetical protein [Anoxybacillus sp. ST4]